MKKVLILGAGQMGKDVALDLGPNKYEISVLDSVSAALPYPRIRTFLRQDFRTASFGDYDLVINCLPSCVGYEAVKLVIEQGTNCVDLSFMEEDPFTLDELAKKNNCCYIPDAGLAPGLSNLFVGRELHTSDSGKLHRADIWVGGVSESPFEPYGYAVTWSVEDLLQEYLRPARVVQKNIIVEHDPLSMFKNYPHQIYFNEIEMEWFYADGLRTLLRLKDKIDMMAERTLRWPGHLDDVRELIKNNEFVKEIKKKCSGIDDTVVFSVDLMEEPTSDIHTIKMFIHGDCNRSAMAATTAGTCAIVADTVLREIYTEPGVHPLEDVGANEEAYDFIVMALFDIGVKFKHEFT